MPDVNAVVRDAEEQMKKSCRNVEHEFSTVRSGRASPAMVEGVMVEHYGTRMPMKQMAAITAPEPRLLVVQPWDRSAAQAIEKGILQSGLGLTPQPDGKVIRIPIPQLTQERRAELDKVIRKMAEEGRVSIRTARRDANEALKKLKSDKAVNEDDCFKAQEQIQALTNQYIGRIDTALKSKETEVATV